MKLSLVATILFCSNLLATSVAAENWTEFHSESWSFYSEKLRKKLNFKTRFFYDAGSVRRSKDGELQLWIKEISDNDRFYVGKGNPQKETSFSHLKLWCEKKKFVILTDEGNVELHESLGDEINSGTRYEMLYGKLCMK